MRTLIQVLNFLFARGNRPSRAYFPRFPLFVSGGYCSIKSRARNERRRRILAGRRDDPPGADSRGLFTLKRSKDGQGNKTRETRDTLGEVKIIRDKSPRYVTFLTRVRLKSSFPACLNGRAGRRREKSRYREESGSIYISRYSGGARQCTRHTPAGTTRNAGSRDACVRAPTCTRAIGHSSGIHAG